VPELIAQTCDPDIEWVEGPRRADRRIYRGHAGVRESFERWLENFDEYGITEVERTVDCGARGGARNAQRRDHQSADLRRVHLPQGQDRYEEFYEEQDALEAADLRE
jgi:hypothetical protein